MKFNYANKNKGTCNNGDICLCAKSNPTIIDIVKASNDHSTLVTALESTGLTADIGKSSLIGQTLFAPTNEAFKTLPNLQAILNDPNGALKALLMHHRKAETFTTKELRESDKRIMMLDGNDVSVAVVDGKVEINNVGFVQKDIMASNGVVHVIDKVWVPPVSGTIEKGVCTMHLNGVYFSDV